MADLPARLGAQLLEALGPEGVRQGEDLALLNPGVHPGNFQAGFLVRPDNTADVARVLTLCNAAGVGVVPQGGRTGLAGGAVSHCGEVILSLERMNRIEDINVVARTATVEAGVTLERLDSELRPHALCAGIDLGARGSATIGGLISTNAGGNEAFRYGTMRGRVLGLEVALADGSVINDLVRVLKHNAGIPLRQLFIGSEGTLGVVTRAVLSLVPKHGTTRSMLVVVPDFEAAVKLLRRVEAHRGWIVTAAELMSANHVAMTARELGLHNLGLDYPGQSVLLFTLAPTTEDELASAEGLLAEAVSEGFVTDAVLPKSELEERNFWRIREDWSVDRVRPGGLWFDVSVPLDSLQYYWRALQSRVASHDPSLEVFVVGHLADGNLHVTINSTRPIIERYDELSPVVYEGLRNLGGSFSAEHGIGLEKRAALERYADPQGVRLMRAVKSVFDPKGILNPDKVLRGGQR